MAEKPTDVSPNNPAGSSPQEERHSGNWWDSWLTSAKTKSAEVYTMVKKDLDEIGTAVKCEASHVFTSTSTAIGKTLKLDEPESPANVMKKSFSTFIGQVNTVLNPEPDDEDDTEVILSSGDTTMLSTYKKELDALQRVDATFIVPANSTEFDAWKSSLELSDSAAVIGDAAAARRLSGNALLAAQYDKLVPDAVSREDFWERYLFRVALLQDRLAAASRKQPQEVPSTDPVLAHLPLQTAQPMEPILESPKKVISPLDMQPSEGEGEDTDTVVTWEDEDFANDVELTEEQQILLLEEYEREIASKKTKQTSTRDITNSNTKSRTTNTTPSKTGNTKTGNAKLGNIKTSTAKPDSTKTGNAKSDSTKSANAKTGNAKAKAPQTRDKMNNKQTTDKKSKAKTPTKTANSDVCGNNLVEDYFADSKDDSDESWEKEFEIEEQKA